MKYTIDAIIRLKGAIEEEFGEDSGLLKISVSNDVFNMMVVESFKSPLTNSDGNHLSYFKPSDAHSFKLAGVKIEPCNP